jgi:hypothetical protein
VLLITNLIEPVLAASNRHKHLPRRNWVSSASSS